ncbi:hypothetical protein RHGRI_031626 [Rhododendron griersonianum]|uniref:F-box protein n=1 Tax=Rhododendron griersonianum TaxID=479676 RepID=A0AAV6IB36_9ERIC|nr:hypothetical protein RHGRI_031626 [Rhododendron griersonianum]
MGSKRWHQKKKRKLIGGEEEEEEGEEDRISSLPDSILHQILSSIDTTSVVQTSVCQRDGGTFGLRYQTYTWITTHFRTLSKTAYAMHFDTMFKNCFSGPTFSYKPYVGVSCLWYATRQTTRLPALKTLRLAGCCHDYANFITETVGNCTNLETLILDDLELNSLNINAPNLRNLELHYYDDDCSCGNCFESMIVVSAPGLTSFKLEGHALTVFSAASLPCLQNVHVRLKTWSFDEYDVPDEVILQRMPLNVMKMLEQLGEADYVTLSMDTVKALAKDPDSLNNRPSPFRKLKHLKLTTPSRSSNLPLNVIAYLTKGSSSDTLVGDFYSLGLSNVSQIVKILQSLYFGMNEQKLLEILPETLL